MRHHDRSAFEGKYIIHTPSIEQRNVSHGATAAAAFKMTSSDESRNRVPQVHAIPRLMLAFDDTSTMWNLRAQVK